MGLMPSTSNAFIFLGLAVVGLLIAAWIKGGSSRRGGDDEPLELIAHALMTDAEKRFFAVLEAAAPSFLVCPQVAMSAIVTRPKHQNRIHHRAAFSQKRLDFVLADRETLTARLVVELDDSSHRGREHEDARRDAMLFEAGYAILRVPVRQTYSTKDLSARIQDALGHR